MQSGMDAVARDARVVRLDEKFRWPGGRHVAVVLNVAYEGWADAKAPGIGPMGNPLPAGTFDTNALSWGSYGAERGIGRLLRALEQTQRRASVMVSGIFGERTPATVRAIAEAGHEIVAHGFTQDTIPAQLSPDQVRTDIAKTTSHAHVYGRPAGAWAFEAIAAKVGAMDNVWLATRGEIAAHVRQALRPIDLSDDRVGR